MHYGVMTFLCVFLNSFKKFLPTQIKTCFLFLFIQNTFYLRLRCNSSVICTWKPKGFISFHPMIANEYILNYKHECMADMEISSNVWGRKNDAIRVSMRIYVRLKIASIFPHLI